MSWRLLILDMRIGRADVVHDLLGCISVELSQSATAQILDKSLLRHVVATSHVLHLRHRDSLPRICLTDR
jgi:hypothetical protein